MSTDDIIEKLNHIMITCNINEKRYPACLNAMSLRISWKNRKPPLNSQKFTRSFLPFKLKPHCQSALYQFNLRCIRTPTGQRKLYAGLKLLSDPAVTNENPSLPFRELLSGNNNYPKDIRSLQGHCLLDRAEVCPS